MSHSKHPVSRLLGAAGIALALSAVLPAHAQEIQGGDSLTVVRDAETGKLRAATAEEQAALKASATRFTVRAVAARPVPKFHASGARGLKLTDEFMNNAVAVRKPDGSVQILHDGAEATQGQAHVPANTAVPVTE